MQQFGKMFGGGGEQGKSTGMMQSVIGMVSDGGLNGLVQKFQSAGLQDKVQSWLSPDSSNQELSGDEVKQALGDQEVERIAQENGVSKDEAADNLASSIPATVNDLTPDGQYPDQQTLQQRIGSLAGKIPGL